MSRRGGSDFYGYDQYPQQNMNYRPQAPYPPNQRAPHPNQRQAPQTSPQGHNSYFSQFDNSYHDNSSHHYGDTVSTVVNNSGSHFNIGGVSNANFGVNHGTISQNNGMTIQDGRATIQSGPPSHNSYYPSVMGPPAPATWNPNHGRSYYDEGQGYRQRPEPGIEYDYDQGYRNDWQGYQQQEYGGGQLIEAPADVPVPVPVIHKPTNPFTARLSGGEQASSASIISQTSLTTATSQRAVYRATQERGTPSRANPSQEPGRPRRTDPVPQDSSYSEATERMGRKQTQATDRAARADSYSEVRESTRARQTQANTRRPPPMQPARERTQPSPPPESELDAVARSDSEADREPYKRAPSTKVVIQRRSPASAEVDSDIEEARRVLQRDEDLVRKKASSKAREVAARESVVAPATTRKSNLKRSDKQDDIDSQIASAGSRVGSESAPPVRTRRVSFASEAQVQESRGVESDEELVGAEGRQATTKSKDHLRHIKSEASVTKDEGKASASESKLDHSISPVHKPDDDSDDLSAQLSKVSVSQKSPKYSAYHDSALFDDDIDDRFAFTPVVSETPRIVIASPSAPAASSGLDHSEKDGLQQAGEASVSSVAVSAPSPTPAMSAPSLSSSPGKSVSGAASSSTLTLATGVLDFSGEFNVEGRLKDGKKKSGITLSGLKKRFGGGKEKKGKEEQADYGVVGAPGVREY